MSVRYHAPAVAYGFERPRWAAAVLLLVWLALWVALLGWCQAAQWSPPKTLVIASAALLLAAWLLYRQWRYWPRGRLLWNGEHWLLESALPSGQGTGPLQLKVGLDGGSWLWLNISSLIRPESIYIKHRLLWILISQSHSPAQWGDLRRAVYSSAVPLTEQG
ncbi:hypothetical protein DZC30_03325 [Comamonas testosteroni]|uniref:Toxin CptA n=1 Tax=Comamonas testosteroni TaxID=285 RepID=A0A373FTM9_COMTE|nr:hypothetical protein [Comamonas testosteroni]RGE46805.1 hypothetical protein DZC30_03325 [Comamonas testosteroni]